MRGFVCLCVGVLIAGAATASCFSVYDRSKALVYRHDESPVDMSNQIGDEVERRFGVGASMVFNLRDDECGREGVASGVTPFDGPGWEHLVVGSPQALAASGVGSGGGAAFGRVGAMGYPNTGPRGGKFRYTSGGSKTYAPRR